MGHPCSKVSLSSRLRALGMSLVVVTMIRSLQKGTYFPNVIYGLRLLATAYSLLILPAIAVSAGPHHTRSEMQSLAARVAIVTGGSKGIGAGIATSLAAAGAAVAVNYAADADTAGRLVDAITADGGRAIAVQADVSNPDDVIRLFAETDAALGHVDLLVNNAGRYAFAALGQITVQDYRRDFDLNVLGPLLTMQQFAKQPSADGGAIINITAAVVSTNPPGTGIYTATKSALTSLSRVIAKKLAPRRIRVNVIAPTATNTEGTRALGLTNSDSESPIASQIPLGRIGVPEDIGPVAVFLASEAAHWITGDVIHASGGHR